MRVYADSAAYASYTGTAAPANVDALLRAASQAVDVLLTGVVYDTDTDGMPTDAGVVQAMSDATCAIAQSANANGSLTAASTTSWDSVSIGSVSLSGRSSSTSATTVAGVPVPPAALFALDQVGTRLVVVL